MSYDIMVLSVSKAFTSEQAGEIIDGFQEGRDVDQWLGDREAIRRFLDELAADYPSLDDVPEDDLDDCPWNSSFEVRGGLVYLAVAFSRSSEMTPVIHTLARRHGLAFYDCQTGLVCLPDRLVETAGIRLTCPWLPGEMPASRELIADLIPFLTGKDDPFFILADEGEVYMQTLWTEDGYVLEYRAGDADNHFEAESLLSREEAIETLADYALRGTHWQDMHAYSRVEF